MRVLLKKGKQQELILKVKQSTGMTWRALALKLKTSINGLSKDWRYEKNLLPKKEFDKLNNSIQEDYSKYIIKFKNNNWGKIKGAKISNNIQRKKKRFYIKKSTASAELVGILLGDGSIYQKIDKGVHLIRISGHAIDDKEYFINTVISLEKKILHKKPRIKQGKGKCIFTSIQSSSGIDALGFTPSRISCNKVYLTRQSEIARYLKEIGFNNSKHRSKIYNSPVV